MVGGNGDIADPVAPIILEESQGDGALAPLVARDDCGGGGTELEFELISASVWLAGHVRSVVVLEDDRGPRTHRAGTGSSQPGR